MSTSTPRLLSVFLCHSSGDKDTVRELYEQLITEYWIDPWLDKEKIFPGQDWNLEIEKAVEAADVILVCLSNDSITKEGYVQRELRNVLDYADYKPEGTLYIIPVRLEECEPPRRLRRWQYVDYFPPNNRDWAYRRLLVSLRERAKALGIVTEKAESKPEPTEPTTEKPQPQTIPETPETKTISNEVKLSQVQSSAEEYFAKGLSKYQDGAYLEAIADYDRAIQLNPKSAQAYYNRGVAYADLGNYRNAIRNYDNAIQLNYKHPNTYYNRGLAYAGLGDYQSAILDYDKAIQLNPTHAKAYYNRGLAYAGLGDTGRAIADYDQTIQLNPEFANVYHIRGLAYAGLGDFARAITDYDMAIQLNPQYTKAYNSRGNAYKKLGDNKRAEEDFAKAKEIESGLDKTKR